MDCGVCYPSPVMHFHHRPGEVKLHNVGSMVRSHASDEAIDAEIMKCDLLCANCHMLRHIAEGTVGSQVSDRVLE